MDLADPHIEGQTQCSIDSPLPRSCWGQIIVNETEFSEPRGKLVAIAICLFAQCVSLLGILIGLVYATQLLTYASIAIQGQPWQGGELARLIALVCGPVLVGLFTFVGLAWYLWSSQVTRQRMRQYPDQPWMWQSDWAEKSIHLSNRSTLWITIISSVLYGLVVAPMDCPMALSSMTFATGRSRLNSQRRPI